MDRLIFGHSFAVLVAVALILLSVLAFNFLKREKTSLRRDGEDRDISGSGLPTAPAETNANPSSSSIALTGNRYDVFLSFRGPDTREGFTDHLYYGLMDAGIRAFRDDNELRQGEQIGPDLLAAIKNSKILIPIISVTYSSSKWCLDELVQMMECKNNNTGHLVLPIFYKVEPSHVRHQIGSFGNAFRTREKRFDLTILEKWKQALKEVSDLKGWEAKGYEGELVKKVVQKVLSELKKEFELVIPENLVGIDTHVEKIMEFVDKKFSATLFVGIHGMGGIGKTTLAKAIYNKLFHQFEYHSFIADIRESSKRNGLEYLQNQLISIYLNQKNQVSNKDEGIKFISSKFEGKKVLILLDDVDDDDQLKSLAGNHNWFSSGSRIMVTTGNKAILDNWGMDHSYEHKEMDMNQSLILFCRHAFRRDFPPSEFEEDTRKVISTTGGLPLSLEVLGSFLCGKKPTLWRDAINKLRKVPHQKVREKLRISYEALEHGQKQIFLDVACFFIGTDGRIASYMWDACGFYPEEGIEVLRFMSLIKVEDDHKLRMHDQLRDLGGEIIREENQLEPRYRSRLWDSEEILKVLKRNKGTEKIQAIYLSKGSSECSGKTADQDCDIHTGEQFKNLTSLRLLHVNGARFSGDFENSIEELRWLCWWNCPSTFEANNFHTTELVVLDLSRSKISDEWRGWSSIMMAKKLKFLDLTECRSLKGTFFLSAFTNLEVLILQGCEEVEQIDSLIGDMKSLVRLDLGFCRMLKDLPAEVGKLDALKQLHLQYCPKISVVPDSIGALQNLEILDMRGSGIRELPDSIGALQNLKILEISETRIKELPESVGALQNLEILKINDTQLKELPESIGALQNLEIMYIGWTRLKELPNGIGRLTKLRELDVACSDIFVVPESISHLSSLQRLELHRCKKLRSLPELPSSLTSLSITCQSPRLRSLTYLTHLKKLQLWGCKILECISELPSTVSELSECSHLANVEESELPKSVNTPFNLGELWIMRCNFMQILDVSHLSHLTYLYAEICYNLLEIRGLDELKCLETLIIKSCISIERLDLPKFGSVKVLSVENCQKLVEIQGMDRLEFLERLKIRRCTSIARLDLSKSAGMKKLYVEDCESLVEIQGLDKLELLKELGISGCPSIQRLDLPKSEGLKILNAKDMHSFCNNILEVRGLDKLKYLERLNIEGSSIERLDLPKSECMKKLNAKDCKTLVEIQGLDRLEFLEELNISGCISLERLDLPKTKGMKKLDAENCDNLVEIQGLDGLEFLEELYISGCVSIEMLDLPQSGRLRMLYAGNCENLVKIQGLDRLEFLKELYIPRCVSLERLDLPKSESLNILDAENCKNLVEIQGLRRSKFLKELYISGCLSVERLDLPKSKSLRIIDAENCKNLVEIQGLERLESLEKLYVSGCVSIERLDLPKSKSMNILYAGSCKNLVEIQGLDRLEFLEELYISGCVSIERLDLPKSESLKILDVERSKTKSKFKSFGVFIQFIGQELFVIQVWILLFLKMGSLHAADALEECSKWIGKDLGLQLLSISKAIQRLPAKLCFV
ncbi:disease resistance protein L6-like [Rhodamnia argentea]|uniref:Disease resistance protein L6-like n=1 Tax=Rhodamnia argentea TaxID=178133 RepID=A0ABM3H8N9_9MYRT|nr:disease resistance protein L6-like [Rhodamnia argentea]